MNECNTRDEIVRLEEQIDELADRIESCRKFILVGRIAVIGGGMVLIAMLFGAIQFNLSVMAVAMAAILGGIVVAGSNRGTAKEVSNELSAAEVNAVDVEIAMRRSEFRAAQPSKPKPPPPRPPRPPASGK